MKLEAIVVCRGMANSILSNEKVLHSSVSANEMSRLMQDFSKLNRLSGTAAEREAANLILDRLEEYRVNCEILEFEAFLSHPGQASLEILEPEHRLVKCITHSFAARTPSGGVEAQVVYAGSGTEEDLAVANARAKIVLADGAASPFKVYRSQCHGAIAEVFISEEEIPHEMIVTSIWGTPTPESASRMPAIHVLSVARSDGELLKQLLRTGRLRVRIQADVWTGWSKIPLVIAAIPGVQEPDKFVLIGGHYDSWYQGVTDNATGNAACLEIARILSANRNMLRRGVKIAWWPGHSHGRYAGSTWYSDMLFEEIDKNAIAYINIDSPGCVDATTFIVEAMAELRCYASEIVRRITGAPLEELKPGRWGDQSFWGIGLPSVDAYSMLPRDKRAAVGGSGGGWWWHSPFDTLDKADLDILARDVRVQLSIVLGLVNAPILPYNFVDVAEEILQALQSLQERSPGSLGMKTLVAEAGRFREEAKKLQEAVSRVSTMITDDSHLTQVNDLLMKASHVITPVLYTVSGRYDQDPAWDQPLLPGLNAIKEIHQLNPESNEYKFLSAWLIRERNRVCDALGKAKSYMEIALRKLSRISGETAPPPSCGM